MYPSECADSFPGAEQMTDQLAFNWCIIKQGHPIRPRPAIIKRPNDVDFPIMCIST
jgi:hypothetical protein